MLKNISQFHSTCLSFPNCYMGLATQTYFAKVLSSLICEPLKSALSFSDERHCRCQTWVYTLSQRHRHGHIVWSAWRTALDRRQLSSAGNVGIAGAKITDDAYTGVNSCYRNQEPPSGRCKDKACNKEMSSLYFTLASKLPEIYVCTQVF